MSSSQNYQTVLAHLSWWVISAIFLCC